jgi:hypothetical protein
VYVDEINSKIGHRVGMTLHTVLSRKIENSRAHFLQMRCSATIELISRRPIQNKPFCTMIKQTSTYTNIKYKQIGPTEKKIGPIKFVPCPLLVPCGRIHTSVKNGQEPVPITLFHNKTIIYRTSSCHHMVHHVPITQERAFRLAWVLLGRYMFSIIKTTIYWTSS